MQNEMTGKIIAMELEKNYAREKYRHKSNRIEFIYWLCALGLAFVIGSIIVVTKYGLREYYAGLYISIPILIVMAIFGYYVIWPVKKPISERTRLLIFENGISPGFRPTDFVKRKKHLFIPWIDVKEVTNVSIFHKTPEKWVYLMEIDNAHTKSIKIAYADFSKEDAEKVREVIEEVENKLRGE